MAKLSLFGDQKKEGWKNKLIWGDNKLVIASLLREYAGKINLIYIDPPFDVGADFSLEVTVGDEEITKEPSILEEKAYRDTWGLGTNSYLQMMYERLVLIRELLADNGVIYLHCDWHVGHYLKVIMDEIFGRDNFQNELVIHYTAVGLKALSKKFHQNTESVFYYAKAKGQHIWNPVYEPIKDPTRYRKASKHTWNAETRKAERLRDETGKIVYFEVTENKADNFIELPALRGDAKIGYPTQKHEHLLERIVRASSNEGDLVADFFCGSGTTGAVAERLGRKWIMCDLGRFAIHTSRKRLMEVQRILKEQGKPYSAFEILNLGKYERQHWQAKNIKGSQSNKEAEYIKFIIQLYKGEVLSGFINLHGKKEGRVIHVGAVDAPVTIAEVLDAVEECKSNKLNALDILGWEWEMSVNEEAVNNAKAQGVHLRLLQIPKEVMEKQAVENGEVRFFELNHMAVEVERQASKVKVSLTGFAIPSEDLIPDELREKITNWADYVDYWSVDWDYESLKEGSDDVFENNWQSFRTKQTPKLELETPYHQYPKAGKYTIAVKAIDIFGNDTSKTVEVTVK